MIDYNDFITVMESGKTNDGVFHYLIENKTDEGLYNSLINIALTPDELLGLYESIKDSHEIDLEFTEYYQEPYPRFMLVV